MEIQTIENCYVVVRGRCDNKRAYDELLEYRHSLEFHPEQHMTFIDTVTYVPYQKSIVTENPYLISSYDKRKVWVLNENDEWVNPSEQTFGCSVNVITSNILGFNDSIPVFPKTKLMSLVGAIPEGCETYGDMVEHERNKLKNYKYS
jgi:hypothetical protein